MLVTVSGIVGSGKSTAANRIARELQRQGMAATVWRFQSLPCFAMLRSRRTRRPVAGAVRQPPAPRWVGYRRRRLTARAALTYVARILAFRAFRRLRGTREWYVSNRYFYDSLVHYGLRTRQERLYGAVIRRLIPTPDLAILLVASSGTIAARRPHYSREYLASVGSAYESLRAMFPGLIEISTDPGESTLADLDAALERHLLSFGLHNRALGRCDTTAAEGDG